MKKRFHIKKKGFTLLELLAVIVVLAIILLIVVPIVLNVIDDSRKGAFESSAMGLIKAAENECLTARLNKEQRARLLTFPEDEDQLYFSGEGPDGGQIRVLNSCRVEIAIHKGDWCARKTADEREVTLTPYDGDCSLEEAIAAQCVGDLWTEINWGGQIESYLDNNTLCLQLSNEDLGQLADSALEITTFYNDNWWDYYWEEIFISTYIYYNEPAIWQDLLEDDSTAWDYFWDFYDDIWDETFDVDNYLLSNPDFNQLYSLIPFNEAGIMNNFENEQNLAILLDADIRHVVVMDGITYLGESAFDGTTYNPENYSYQEYFDNGIQFIMMPPPPKVGIIESLIIGSDVETIGGNFMTGNELTTLIIPSNVEIIFSGAFANNELIELILEEGIETISNGAFANNNLTEVTFPNSLVRAGGFSSNELSSLEFPSNVTNIGDFGRNNLTEVIIGDNVTVTTQAFWTQNEGVLESVIIGNNVTLQQRAFVMNPNIATINIGSNVTINDFMLGSGYFPNQNYFRDSYLSNGSGIYSGDVDSDNWIKID